MRSSPPDFSRKYLAALTRHVRRREGSSPLSARRLGLLGVKLGLDTLAMAGIHEEALIALLAPATAPRESDRAIRLAGVFFTEAITPIEETHRGARQANVRLLALIETLSQRTGELAATNRKLKREIIQRKATEDSLRTSETTTSMLLVKSRRMQEELRHLSRRLLSVQEDERKRISRELHDVIAQTLTGINLRLATLKLQSSANTRDLREKIAITQKLVENSVDIVHRFARDLRPAVLDDLGLEPALRSYIRAFAKQTGIRVDFTAFLEVEKLDGVAKTVLYRVAQEALTNVARHAKAGRASVRIRRQEGGVCMTIRDDGRGFSIDRASSAGNKNRLGLLGMRERSEMIGGAFFVESAPGKKTTIRVEIPPQAPDAEKRPRKKSRAAKVESP